MGNESIEMVTNYWQFACLNVIFESLTAYKTQAQARMYQIVTATPRNARSKSVNPDRQVPEPLADPFIVDIRPFANPSNRGYDQVS